MEGRRLVFNAQSARTVILQRQSSRMHSAYFLSPFVLHKRLRKRVSHWAEKVEREGSVESTVV